MVTHAVSRATAVATACSPYVVKLGGRALETPGAERELAADLLALGAPVVLVHGGGPEVTAWCDRLGLASRFEDGLRVTDADTLEVAVAVLAGLVNQRLVARLRDAGLDAVGISAASGGLGTLEPHRNADRLGAVGTVASVRPALLQALLVRGFVPVVSSLGARSGALLNVNADELAGALAAALSSRALLLLTDVPAVQIGGERIARCSLAEAALALGSPDVQGGMRPKLAAALHAASQGARAVIGQWSGPGSLASLLDAESTATTVMPDEPWTAPVLKGAVPAGAAEEARS